MRTFVVHARKAWLKGSSPEVKNRDLPPLDYPLVYRLKAERPGLTIVINGGVPGLDAAEAHLAHVDGVMLGRAAYHEPGLLGAVDRRLFGEASDDTDPWTAVQRYRPLCAGAQRARGVAMPAMIRPMLGLFHGWPGARAWRRILTVDSIKPGAGIEVIDRALQAVVPR